MTNRYVHTSTTAHDSVVYLSQSRYAQHDTRPHGGDVADGGTGNRPTRGRAKRWARDPDPFPVREQASVSPPRPARPPANCRHARKPSPPMAPRPGPASRFAGSPLRPSLGSVLPTPHLRSTSLLNCDCGAAGIRRRRQAPLLQPPLANNSRKYVSHPSLSYSAAAALRLRHRPRRQSWACPPVTRPCGASPSGCQPLPYPRSHYARISGTISGTISGYRARPRRAHSLGRALLEEAQGRPSVHAREMGRPRTRSRQQP